MTAAARPVADFTPEQLRFPSIPGFTIRGDFAGGEISSNLGALVLEAVDRRIGLMDRLAATIDDSRDPRYITPTLGQQVELSGIKTRRSGTVFGEVYYSSG